MGIVFVFMSQILSTDLSPELMQINQCGSSVVNDHYGNESTMPSCFEESHNSSIASVIVESVQPRDQQHAVWFFAILMCAVYLFFVVVFRPKYKRVESEKRASFEQSVYVGPLNR